MALPTHIDPIPLPAVVTVTKWSDRVVETLGYPMDAEYVETFWLPIIGPTATWLARRLAQIAANDAPTPVPLVPLAAAIGISDAKLGKNDTISKAITRLRVFGIVRFDGDTLEARTHLAGLTYMQAQRLPRHLRALLDAEERAIR
jgi:hypothetical protein